MTFGQLQRYIRDLKQSGFDTKHLSVQLNVKLAYPLVTLVMAVLAIPFALSMGKRGSLTGIATAIGVAIAYWVVNLTVRCPGRHQLPARLAGGVVARPAVCPCRNLPAAAHAHLRRLE